MRLLPIILMFWSSLSLADLAIKQSVSAEQPDDLFGYAVSINRASTNGKTANLAIAAPSDHGTDGYAGTVYLLNSSNLQISGQIRTKEFGDNLGIAMDFNSDFNLDGHMDLVLGARGNDGNGRQAGRAYIFYGPIKGQHMTATADVVFSGKAFDEVGNTISSGDLNGDGLADLLLAAPLGGADQAGKVYVFLAPFTKKHYLPQDANLLLTGAEFNEYFGSSIDLNDINADGQIDIIVGAPRPPLNGRAKGKTYIFLGPITKSLSATEADIALSGEFENDEFGSFVTTQHDVNGDGHKDLLVNARRTFSLYHGSAIHSLTNQFCRRHSGRHIPSTL